MLEVKTAALTEYRLNYHSPMTNNQLQIQSFDFGPFGTNTYVVSTEKNVLLIDPACSNEYERKALLDYINSLDIPHSTFHIIATHGHLDHLWGAAWATEQWNTPVYIHPADMPMVQAMQQQYDLFGIRQKALPFQTASLTEYRPATPDIVHTGLSILSTPGHTPGSVCFYFPDDNVLFSGDTLFCMGYGRTDLPGGDFSQLIQSLNTLFELPAATRVYPGHGQPTTIGAERR